MKRLLSVLWSNSPRILVASAIAGVLAGVSNTLMLAIINRAVAGEGEPGMMLAWGFLALVFFLPLAMLLSDFLLVQLTQGLNFRLQLNLIEQILMAPLRKLEAMGNNKLYASLTKDVGNITNVLGTLPALIVQSTVLLGCLIYLFILSWQALVGVLIAMIGGVFAYTAVQSRGENELAQARNIEDHLFKHFEALIHGTKELKLHQARSDVFLKERVYNSAESLLQRTRMGTVYYSIAASMGRFIFFGVVGLYVFMLPKFLPGVTKEVLTGYALVMLYLLSPLELVTSVIPFLVRAVISLNKINALGATLEKARVEVDQTECEAFSNWHTLELENVEHTYHREQEDTSFTMGPINLTFTPGELVFLVGGNGSGKTTLAKMILGLYTPERGQVLLNGQPITDQNRKAFRQNFSAVFVDFYLFEELIGLEGPDLDERAGEYLDLLLLHHKVSIEGGKLSSTNLSQGQRKRLALLTAYLEDRPIYLFDEWAADQDPAFKKVFYRKLLPDLRAQGKTCIVISHDDAYYDEADRIIKLESGQVIQNQKVVKA